jgi:hypothetical protein
LIVKLFVKSNKDNIGTLVVTLILGSRLKQKGLQGCGPKESPGVTSHAPGSVGKCEGVNPHTPKATPTLGDGVPVDSRNFRERFQGSKLNGL